MMYDHQEENLRVYKGRSIRRTNPFGFWVVEGSPEKFTQISMALNYVDTMPDKETKLKKRT